MAGMSCFYYEIYSSLFLFTSIPFGVLRKYRPVLYTCCRWSKVKNCCVAGAKFSFCQQISISFYGAALYDRTQCRHLLLGIYPFLFALRNSNRYAFMHSLNIIVFLTYKHVYEERCRQSFAMTKTCDEHFLLFFRSKYMLRRFFSCYFVYLDCVGYSSITYLITFSLYRFSFRCCCAHACGRASKLSYQMAKDRIVVKIRFIYHSKVLFGFAFFHQANVVGGNESEYLHINT